MVEKEGKWIRERVAVLQEKANQCIREEGLRTNL